jgi:transposase InsO family protein
MVGRILTQLKRRGQLVEPPRTGVPGSRRALRRRPYAVRKPKQYAVSEPGDLVEVDTVELRPLLGVIFKQFTARDVVSRWDVLQAHTRATAQTATQFLDTLQLRMPFPIRAVQVDGGSEFAAQFEQACQQRGLRLFVLPPRSPKLNGAVERANRTHSEEFYQVTPCSLEMKKLNRELRQWEKIYNTVRPHQSLGSLTPHQFLLQLSSPRKE